MRQLLPPAICRQARVEGVEWSMPAVSIEDQPRFAWLGGHLDVARHFMPKEFVMKYVDLLALHTLNTLHLQLTACCYGARAARRDRPLSDGPDSMGARVSIISSWSARTGSGPRQWCRGRPLGREVRSDV